MKKFLSAVLALTMLFTTAYAFPQSIWAPLDQFAAATDSGDDWGMYTIGKQLIEIMENEPDSQEKTEFLAGKYAQLPAVAERLGFLEEAVELYKKYLPYGELMNWSDGVESAKSKINALTPSLDVYVADEDYYPVNYGAKFEPDRGVLFGSVYDNDSRILDFNQDLIKKYFPKKNSNYLIYLDYGEDIHNLGRYERYFKDAAKNNVAVMFAFNLTSLYIDMDYVKTVIDFVASYNIPVFVRFGAEMNVSALGNDPDGFIQLFRQVADYVHTKSNLAMVWSPNDISGLDKPFEMFYPGDEYVDWVGVSHYVIKYFQGYKDHGDQTDVLNTYFATGDYANSLLRIKHIMNFMEENNIQKPVMLSECGVGHAHRLEGEDTTGWAEIQLARIYGELIKKYQNIKMVNYFNVLRSGEPYAFELFTNDYIYSKYNQLVENDYFLSDINGNAPYGYKPVTDGLEIAAGSELSVVGYYPKALYSTVKIKANGSEIATLSSVPYTYNIDLAEGNYDLTFDYMNGSDVAISKTFNVNIVNEITVELNGEKIHFADQKPIIDNGRTLVPLRAIFEALGAEVDWDGNTQTVTASRGNIQISLQINSEEMKVNDDTRVLDVPAKLVNGRTMVPVRAISEAFGCNVGWDGATRTVSIK